MTTMNNAPVRTRKSHLSLAALGAGVAMGALIAATPASAQYDGVTVNVITFTGPQIAEPLQRRAPDFSAATGAQVNVITVPFSDLYTRLLTDWATGTNSIDAAVFAPQWAVDFIQPGFVTDITDWVEADDQIQSDDIAPFFREFSQQFNGRTYMLTLDGDFQMVYYRTDVLDQLGMDPPETWDDYLTIAEAAHGTDMNGDGEADYGSCISKKRNAQAYWAIYSIAGGFLQSQGTGQGGFFDTEDMTPLVDNEAFRRALQIYVDTTQYGPPDEINLDVGDTRGLFTAGRCALTVDWGDIGTLAIDPETSSVIDLVGAAVLPGSTEVLDRETGELVACTPEICPYAVDGVNHAPFAAFGGWSGGINAAADPQVQEAAYAFFSWMSQPEHSNEDVTIGRTGFNPYRLSQFDNIDNWVNAGMSEAAAVNYLSAIGDSLSSPNMLLDLRIPQNQRYQQIVLDTALARLLAGEIDIDQTVQAINDGWEEITDDLGREEQLAAYRSALGQ